jgi:hypothetical protein
MKHAARLASALAALVLVAACTTIDKDEWLVLSRSGKNRPEIISVRSALPADAIRARFPVLLQIEWGYESLPNGMPTEREIERGRQIYAALDRLIGARGVYAMSRTGDGGRTMYYYVDDPAPHATALRTYFDSLLPISIQVTVRKEPDWRSVREVLSAAN